MLPSSMGPVWNLWGCHAGFSQLTS